MTEGIWLPGDIGTNSGVQSINKGVSRKERRVAGNQVVVAVAVNHAHVTSTLPLALAASWSKALGLTSISSAAHPVPVNC